MEGENWGQGKIVRVSWEVGWDSSESALLDMGEKIHDQFYLLHFTQVHLGNMVYETEDGVGNIQLLKFHHFILSCHLFNAFSLATTVSPQMHTHCLSHEQQRGVTS